MNKEWTVKSLEILSGFILALMLILILSGCSKRVYVPVESVRTEYREADTTGLYNRIAKLFEARREREVKSDSVVDRTKETVVLNERGDTTKHIQTKFVYVASNREKELEQKVSHQDSVISDLRTQLLSVKSDSIPVPYPVEKQLTKWQQAKMDLGGIAMGGLGIVVCFIVIWLIKKFKK